MAKINEAFTFLCLSSMRMLKMAGNKIKDRVDEVRRDESGIEVVAVVLILVIVLGLVIIFKNNIKDLLQSLWEKIFSDRDEVTGGSSSGSSSSGSY